MNNSSLIAVVIPCYKVKKNILPVIDAIGKEVSRIYVVDDCCPENTGQYVNSTCKDKRVVVLYHEENKGVGGAVITGYKKAISESMSIVVKVDGDGQMNPEHIPKFIQPILSGNADYTKGNRFFELGYLINMPLVRVFGNSILSFINKISSGYWNIMDPTNGYTAIHTNILRYLPLDKIDSRYFFESDMLFRLSTIRAVVQDIPLVSVYEEEESNLSILNTIIQFPTKYLVRIFKRIFYSYFLRDFNVGSLELVSGLFLFMGGVIYGGYNWYFAISSGAPTATGIIMLATVPVLLGFQLLLSALNYDIYNVPNKPIHTLL